MGKFQGILCRGHSKDRADSTSFYNSLPNKQLRIEIGQASDRKLCQNDSRAFLRADKYDIREARYRGANWHRDVCHSSGENLLDHISRHIGEAEITAVEAIRQAGVVDSEKV